MSAEEMVANITNHGATNPTMSRWRSCKVLIIDEVSMLDGCLFDKLEFVARRVKNCEKAWGGIQLILAGDFFQLPPVGLDEKPRSSNNSNGRGGYNGGRGGGHQSRHPYQGHGGNPAAAAFGNNNNRGGGFGAAAGAPSSSASDAGATFDPKSNGEVIKFCFEAATWKKSIKYLFVLEQVFRQKDPRFVNLLNEWRQGVCSEQSLEVLRRAGSKLDALRRTNPEFQPTRLYSKNDKVDQMNDAELRKCGGEERVYRSSDSGMTHMLKDCQAQECLRLRIGCQVMLLKNMNPEKGLVNGARGVVTGYAENPEGEKPSHVPVVAFLVPGSDIPVSVTVAPMEWTQEQGNKVVAARVQIPLKLAYAITIHKSQGMTIDLMEIDINDVFTEGQAYVALSRSVALERMKMANISRFRPSLVKAHPRVLQFYRGLIEMNREQQAKAKAAAGMLLGTSNRMGSSSSNSAGGGGAVAAGAASSSSSAAAPASSVTSRDYSGLMPPPPLPSRKHFNMSDPPAGGIGAAGAGSASVSSSSAFVPASSLSSSAAAATAAAASASSLAVDRRSLMANAAASRAAATSSSASVVSAGAASSVPSCSSGVPIVIDDDDGGDDGDHDSEPLVVDGGQQYDLNDNDDDVNSGGDDAFGDENDGGSDGAAMSRGGPTYTQVVADMNRIAGGASVGLLGGKRKRNDAAVSKPFKPPARYDPFNTAQQP